MSIVTTVATTTGWAYVKFFWDHSLTGLTATSTASGYDIDNILNRLETVRWVSALTSTQYINFDAGAGNTYEVDYIIIAGHNFATAGITYTLQWSTDNFSADVNDAFTGATSSDDDQIILKEFTALNKRYWRLKIEDATVEPSINICYWGMKTELDFCSASFDPNALNDQAVKNITQTGYIAGIYNKYRRRDITLSFQDAESNLYDKIKDWYDSIGQNNFVLGFDTTAHPNDVFLVSHDGVLNCPYVRQGQYRNITLNFEGRA